MAKPKTIKRDRLHPILPFHADEELQKCCEEMAFAMKRSFLELVEPCLEQRAKQWVTTLAEILNAKREPLTMPTELDDYKILQARLARAERRPK